MTEEICENCGFERYRHTKEHYCVKFKPQNQGCGRKFVGGDICGIEGCSCKKFKPQNHAEKSLSEKRKEILNWMMENLSGGYSEANKKILYDGLEAMENECNKQDKKAVKRLKDEIKYQIFNQKFISQEYREIINRRVQNLAINKIMGDNLI